MKYTSERTAVFGNCTHEAEPRRGTLGVVIDAGFGEAGGITRFSSAREVGACPLISEECSLRLGDALASAKTVLCLRPSGGVAASCDFGRARYEGESGNRITLGVYEDTDGYFVVTYIDGDAVSSQTVSDASEMSDNEYVVFDRSAELYFTAGLPMTGGEDSDGVTDGTEMSALLSAFDDYSPDVILVTETDGDLKSAAAEYVLGRRDAGDIILLLAPDFEGDEEYCFSFSGKCGANAIYFIAGLLAASPFYGSISSAMYTGMCEAYPVTIDEAEAIADEGTLALVEYGNEGVYRVLRDVCSDGADGCAVRIKDEIKRRVTEIFEDGFSGRAAAAGTGPEYLRSCVLAAITELGEKYGCVVPSSVSVSVSCDEDGSVSLTVGAEIAPRAAGFYTTLSVT